jgi:hypothetical protein
VASIFPGVFLQETISPCSLIASSLGLFIMWQLLIPVLFYGHVVRLPVLENCIALLLGPQVHARSYWWAVGYKNFDIQFLTVMGICYTQHPGCCFSWTHSCRA